jgi:hypothetical protein
MISRDGAQARGRTVLLAAAGAGAALSRQGARSPDTRPLTRFGVAFSAGKHPAVDRVTGQGRAAGAASVFGGASGTRVDGVHAGVR